MRGPSGSGKSTLGKILASTGRIAGIASADAFFMKEGVYNFQAKLLGRAHSSSKQNFTSFLEKGFDVVVVDNTNTTAKEIRFYLEKAQEHGATVEIFEVLPRPEDASTWVEDCAGRNQHGVPAEAIQRMVDRMENPIPEDWPVIQVERHDGYFIRLDTKEKISL